MNGSLQCLPMIVQDLLESVDSFRNVLEQCSALRADRSSPNVLKCCPFRYEVGIINRNEIGHPMKIIDPQDLLYISTSGFM